MAECYYCAENNAIFCKVCQESFCKNCHIEHEQSFFDTEYLSPHQTYELEFKGVIQISADIRGKS